MAVSAVWDSARTEAYAQAFFYAEGSPLQKKQFEIVAGALALEPHHRVADIGGGTGSLSQKLHDHGAGTPLQWPVLCVEPSHAMAAMAAEREGVTTECSGAYEFASLEQLCGPAAAAWPAALDGPCAALYDRALLKEVVHLLRDQDLRRHIFMGIFRQLSPGGVCCIFTRPHEPSYPLTKQALEVWQANQPAASTYTSELEQCGFEVDVHINKLPVEMPKAAWMGMISGRVWSTFSRDNFSDAELEGLLSETEHLLGAKSAGETFSFEEEYVVIRAQKPCATGTAGGA